MPRSHAKMRLKCARQKLSFLCQKLSEKVTQQIVATNALTRFRIVTHSYAALFSIKSTLCETKNIFYSQENQNKTKPISYSEGSSKIKVRSRWTVFEILLMTAVICI